MIVAIVQARMSSSRLPGKVLKEILSKPMIGYFFERLRRAQRIDKILLATSINPENDPLCAYVESLGVSIFRGSEENVLERYYLAAQQYGASDVMRLTGDCPLIEPEFCDRLVDEYLKRGVDYACLGPTFAEGLDCEIMKFSTLEKCHHNAALASESEHVTRYIHTHKTEFNLYQMDNSEDHGHYRIVLDEPEDFEMLRTLFENYYGRLHPYARFFEVKGYLDSHPEIMNMNNHILRNEGLLKSLSNDQAIP